MTTPTLHVRIISPKQLILDTQAFAVSSKNLQGKFDILPFHANFITVLENEPILISSSKRDKKPLIFRFPIAIISVTENQVNIYTYLQTQTS